MARRRSILRRGEDSDPMSVVSNLFDVAMVFAVALMVALVSRYNMTEMFSQEDFTMVKNPGTENMEIISVKITSVFETGAVKAKANAVLGRFGVRGIKVCEGKSGLFVAMPSYKSAKGKYIDIFFPMDKEAKEELAGAVLRAYAEKQAENAAAAALAGQEPG